MPTNRTHRTYPWHKRRRKLLWGVMLTLSLLFVLAWVRVEWGQRQDAALVALREAGYPTSPEELVVWLPEVPEEENASPIHEKAFEAGGNLLEEASTEEAEAMWRRISALGPCEPLPGDVMAFVTAFLASQEPMITRLHEAAAYSENRYSMATTHAITDWKHIRKLKRASSTLALQARLAAQLGDTELATKSLITMLTLAETLREEVYFSLQSIRMQCHDILLTVLPKVLCLTQLSDEELAALGEALADTEIPDSLWRILAAQRAINLPGWDNVELEDVAQDIQQDRFLKWVPGKAKTCLFVAQSIGWIKQDRSAYIYATESLIIACRNPYPEAMDYAMGVAQIPDTFLDKYHRFPKEVRRMTTFIRNYIEHFAFMRIAATALAVERYLLATDRLPASLDKLVPSFLSQVPADPCDGFPLGYKPTDEGYVVYNGATAPTIHDEGRRYGRFRDFAFRRQGLALTSE